MLRASAGAMPQSLRGAMRGQTTTMEEVLHRIFRAPRRNLHMATKPQPTASSSLLTGVSRYSRTRPSFAKPSTPFQTQTRRGFRFSPWRRNQGSGGKAEENLSLGQKLRKLSREYGKAAVVVYFMLSILDYPFFFLLVRAVGTDRVGM